MEGASLQPLEITSRLVMCDFGKRRWRGRAWLEYAMTLGPFSFIYTLYWYVPFTLLCLIIASPFSISFVLSMAAEVKGIIIAGHFQGVMIVIAPKGFHLEMDRFSPLFGCSLWTLFEGRSTDNVGRKGVTRASIKE